MDSRIISVLKKCRLEIIIVGSQFVFIPLLYVLHGIEIRDLVVLMEKEYALLIVAPISGIILGSLIRIVFPVIFSAIINQLFYLLSAFLGGVGFFKLLLALPDDYFSGVGFIGFCFGLKFVRVYSLKESKKID